MMSSVRDTIGVQPGLDSFEERLFGEEEGAGIHHHYYIRSQLVVYMLQFNFCLWYNFF